MFSENTDTCRPSRRCLPRFLHRVYLHRVGNGHLHASLALAAAVLWMGCAGGAPPVGTGSATAASAGSIRFARAVVRVEDIQTAAKYEADLSGTYDTLPPVGAAWFTLLDGSSHVLVTAGHATSQTREGKLKPADGGTGSLAMMLNMFAKTPALHTTYASPSDPNFYDDNDFKREVQKLIVARHPRVVLDLHASHPDHPYDVDFGTMEGRSLLGRVSLLDVLAARLHDEGLSNFSQDFFSAAKNETITKWVSALGVPVIQCEINSTWLLPAPEKVQAATSDGGADRGSVRRPADEWANAIQYQRFAALLQGLIRYVGEIDSAP